MPKERIYMRIDRALKQAAKKYADNNFLDLTSVFTQALVEFLRKRGYLNEKD